MRRRRTVSAVVRRRVAPAVLLALGAAACGGTGPAQAPGSLGEPAAEQRVGLLEWEVVTEGRPLVPGEVSLLVTNAGSAPHDLAVSAGDDRLAATPVLGAGGRMALEVSVPAGVEVELWCTVPGHRAAGMTTTLPVAAAPSAGGA